MTSHLAHWFIGLPRKYKAFILITADICFTELALWGAFSLRLGELYVPFGNQWILFAVAPMLSVPIFIKLGLYHSIIRYIELLALWTILQATTLYALVLAFVQYELDTDFVPRTVLPLNWLAIILLVGSSRFFARSWLGGIYERLRGVKNGIACCKKNVVLYGAGSAGIQLAAALRIGREFNPVAFIDDDAVLHKQKINGLRIYPLSALGFLIEKHQVADVLLAIPSASRARRNEIIRLLEPYAIHVKSMPGLADIAQGKVTVDTIQEVDVADLLGRDPVAPDQNLLRANITNKVVMVSGAGGSIGSELCRQIIQLQPQALVLFELSEFALYAIEKELDLLLAICTPQSHIRLITVLGSVTDTPRIEKICNTFKVHTIYHAAAYKHVPMVEKNPCVAVDNNILGTLQFAKAAIAAQVETFVLISTDKAVRPTNTMGATKRFAELVLQALTQTGDNPHTTRFTMVRFGNVLGSSGSVVPLFREQIARGGPVTVTDERIVRYFMTIPEAAQLVIQAGAMGQGGDVFVLDMGEPIRIVDLAKRMIHLSGLKVKTPEHPQGEIEINYTGLRPGEKLYEELLIGDNVSETSHTRIMRAQETMIPWPELEIMLAGLEAATKNDDCQQIRAILTQAVSGFAPQCDIQDIVWKEQGL